jgi:hypothetical protein
MCIHRRVIIKIQQYLGESKAICVINQVTRQEDILDCGGIHPLILILGSGLTDELYLRGKKPPVQSGQEAKLASLPQIGTPIPRASSH